MQPFFKNVLSFTHYFVLFYHIFHTYTHYPQKLHFSTLPRITSLIGAFYPSIHIFHNYFSIISTFVILVIATTLQFMLLSTPLFLCNIYVFLLHLNHFIAIKNSSKNHFSINFMHHNFQGVFLYNNFILFYFI